MNRSVTYWIVFGLAAILQIYFLANVRPRGVVPNLILVLVILAGAFQSATTTVVSALIGGLLLDFASGGPFGFKLAFLLLLALALVLIRQNGLELQKLSISVPIVAGAILFYDLSLVSVVVLAHGLVSWSAVLSRVVLDLLLAVVFLLALKPIMARLKTGIDRG